MVTAASGRVNCQMAYVLHTQPYRETSLLVSAWTRDYGRMLLVARGARRPRADLRGILLPFQPLVFSWFGKTQVKTLHAAHWIGGVAQLTGLALISGFYLNELIMRLTAPEDPHPQLWPVYHDAVRGLAQGKAITAVLRCFELGLISVLGYTPELTTDQNGVAIDPQRYYTCRPGMAPDPKLGIDCPRTAQLKGTTLLAMAANDFGEGLTRREARGLLRLILVGLLGEQVLVSRDLLQSLPK